MVNKRGFSSGGGFSGGGFSDTPTPNKYRKDYGGRMSDEQYSQLEGDKAKFDKEITNFRTSATTQIKGYKDIYDEQKIGFDAQYKKSKGILDSAWEKLGDAPSIKGMFNEWYDKEKVQVRVIDGGTIEQTYWVPRPVIDSMNATTFNKDGSYYGAWDPKNKYYNVDVKVKGGGKRGKELHQIMGGQAANKDFLFTEFANNETVQGGYSKGIKAWNTANQELVTAEETFNTGVAEQQGALKDMWTSIRGAEDKRDGMIGLATATRQGSLDALREEFQTRSAAVRKTYGGMRGMTYEQ